MKNKYLFIYILIALTNCNFAFSQCETEQVDNTGSVCIIPVCDIEKYFDISGLENNTQVELENGTLYILTSINAEEIKALRESCCYPCCNIQIPEHPTAISIDNFDDIVFPEHPEIPEHPTTISIDNFDDIVFPEHPEIPEHPTAISIDNFDDIVFPEHPEIPEHPTAISIDNFDDIVFPEHPTEFGINSSCDNPVFTVGCNDEKVISILEAMTKWLSIISAEQKEQIILLQFQLDSCCNKISTENTTIGNNLFFGFVDNAGNIINGSNNFSIVKVSTGFFRVIFNSPCPSNRYAVTTGVTEDFTNRDVVKISVVEGSRTAISFDLMLTTDDNGQNADVLTDADFSFSVIKEKTITTIKN